MSLTIILAFIFLLGLIIGSFLNCLIWRLHKKIPLTPFPPERLPARQGHSGGVSFSRAGVKGGNKWNRSYCPKCKKQIAWYDNLPILSFIMLGGKCRSCGKRISWQYPAVELATGILFIMAFVYNFEFRIFNFESIFNYSIFNNSIKIQNSKFIIQLLRDWFLICVMIVVFIYDLRWYLILDIITIPVCFVIFIINILLGYSWHNLLLSGIIGGSFFLGQFIISRGRWIGGGDIRLGLLIGLALGWPNALLAIFLGYFIGSFVGLGLILTGKKKWGSEVPLGVFLSAGTIITLFWGNIILNWYSGLF